MNKIVITTGDPNGIGAEITIKALNKLDLPHDKIALISNKKILDFYGKLDKEYELIEIPYDAEIKAGEITKESGEFSFQSVKKACEIGAKAIVTAPVAKNAMYLAGHRFNGQTEILQKYLAHDGQLAEMLFVAGNFRVLLLTRHVALKDINLTKELVVEKITNLKKFFVTHLGITEPDFALCGFNPHAGEDGILGREEIDILIPAAEELREKGVNITNPEPADTLFVNAAREYLEMQRLFQKDFCCHSEGDVNLMPEESNSSFYKDPSDSKCYRPQDDDCYFQVNNSTAFVPQISSSAFLVPKFCCYIANYHDQGLIPIKTVAGIKTVNMTIGLDIIRTSPGHGTAFDIAGKNIADESGMIEAIKAVLD